MSEGREGGDRQVMQGSGKGLGGGGSLEGCVHGSTGPHGAWHRVGSINLLNE